MTGWVRVQGVQETTGSGSSQSATLNTTLIRGDVLVGYYFQNGNSSDLLSSIKDDQNNLYNRVALAVNTNGTFTLGLFWAGPFNTPNQPTTVTVALTAAVANLWIGLDEFQPPPGSAIFIVEGSSAASGAATSGTFTSTFPGDLVYGAQVSVNATEDNTNNFNYASNNGSGASFAAEWKVQGTATSSGSCTWLAVSGNASFNGFALAALPLPRSIVNILEEIDINARDGPSNRDWALQPILPRKIAHLIAAAAPLPVRQSLQAVLNSYAPPDPPYFGAEQPWTPQRSANIQPVVSNPPFAGGAKIPEAVRYWYQPFQPYDPPYFGDAQPWTPQQSASIQPIISNPFFRDGARMLDIIRSVYPVAPDPPYFDDPQPFVPEQIAALIPAQSVPPVPLATAILAHYALPPPGPYFDDPQPFAPEQSSAILPIVNNPPVIGAVVPLTVQQWYKGFQPPDPTFMGSEQPFNHELAVPPPVQPVTPNVIPAAVLNAWYPIPSVITTNNPPPAAATQPVVSNPPFAGGAKFVDAARVWYQPFQPSDPTFMGGEQPFNDQSIAHTIPPLSFPPFAGGAAIPQAVLISYVPPDPNRWFSWEQELQNVPGPQPVVSNPPPTGYRVEISTWYQPTPPQPSIAGYGAVIAQPTAQQPPFSQNPLQAVLNAWRLPPDPPYFGNEQPWAPQQSANLQPIVSNPPVIGSRIPIAVLDAWYPLASIIITNSTPEPAGIMPPLSFPPTTGAVIPAAVLNAWYPIPSVITTNNPPPAAAVQPVVSNPPVIGSRIPLAILNAWLPPDPRFQTTIELPAPSAPPPVPFFRQNLDILSSWYKEPQPMQQFQAASAVEGLVFRREFIRAIVTLKTQAAQTLITKFGITGRATSFGTTVTLDS